MRVVIIISGSAATELKPVAFWKRQIMMDRHMNTGGPLASLIRIGAVVFRPVSRLACDVKEARNN
jgi:hypothetical protein